MVRRPPKTFDPLVEAWSKARSLYRVHPLSYPPSELYATERPARFRPIKGSDGNVVPMLYGAGTQQAAIYESVLHEAPRRGARIIPYEPLLTSALTCLKPRRRLRLAKLHSDGLEKLRLVNTDLTDSPPAKYSETLPWAQALYDHPARYDGIVWMSRRYNSVRACVLFGTIGDDARVDGSDFDLEPSRSYATLGIGRGYEFVANLCAEVDVTIAWP
jgi:hypothetical protein